MHTLVAQHLHGSALNGYIMLYFSACESDLLYYMSNFNWLIDSTHIHITLGKTLGFDKSVLSRYSSGIIEKSLSATL